MKNILLFALALMGLSATSPAQEPEISWVNNMVLIEDPDAGSLYPNRDFVVLANLANYPGYILNREILSANWWSLTWNPDYHHLRLIVRPDSGQPYALTVQWHTGSGHTLMRVPLSALCHQDGTVTVVPAHPALPRGWRAESWPFPGDTVFVGEIFEPLGGNGDPDEYIDPELDESRVHHLIVYTLDGGVEMVDLQVTGDALLGNETSGKLTIPD